MVTFSSLLELVGLLTVVGGLALFDWRLAVIAGGLVLVLIGFATGAPRRPE